MRNVKSRNRLTTMSYVETRSFEICHEAILLLPNYRKSCRMMGRDGVRQATVLKPACLKTDAMPVNTLELLEGASISTGYASSAGALARFAAFNAAVIRADITPCLR